ncbi:5-(carboxyamino)imidazole ribonucleotide synthase [Heyndrickxia sp. MSNUG]|uniref:5-(carboxyamino)imidazole ribonucleotide synthase n=1 Tax=Heyndrickxia sp. MSNUG TaxID=3136677 RepID=UPI003C2F7EF9
MSLSKLILPGQTIGIIGGGQLGKMMALSAKAMGFRVAVLDPTDDCPCGQVADEQILGGYDNLDKIKQLSEISDVITYEFENIDADALEWLNKNAYVPQGTELLRITQDRIEEKRHMQEAGVRVAPYAVVTKTEDVAAGIGKLGMPAVLKTARGGYDGKGQLVIRTTEDIAIAETLVSQGACVLEKWISFEKEISVIITRSTAGETAVFPVAENIHMDNILHETIVPARISKQAAEKAIEAAKQIASALDLTGTLAVEMFLAPNDEIYINELAPRPHNSGHYTIEACETSQFEQHVRSVCGWPLGSTDLLKPAVMVNILGEHQQPLLERITELQDWKIHLYGKKEAKHKRKMGHVTLLRETVEKALEEAEQSGIWESAAELTGGHKR